MLQFPRAKPQRAPSEYVVGGGQGMLSERKHSAAGMNAFGAIKRPDS